MSQKPVYEQDPPVRPLPPEEYLDAARLRGSDDQYRKLVERIPVVTYTADFGPTPNWHFVSPQIETMLGYTPEEWRGQPGLWFDRIHPEDRARVLLADEESQQQLASFSCDYRVIARDGRVVWVRDEAVVTVGRDGADDVMEGILLDITEQKRAEAALAEAEERFRQAFSNAPIGMALAGLDGRFIQVNEALCDLVGYERDDLLLMTFQDITHPDDLEADLAYLQQLIDGNLRGYKTEKRYFDSSGRIVWGQVSVSLVRDAAAEPLHFIAQVEDITDRRQVHDRLEYLADHDPLTGLLNRRRFDEELTRQVAHCERYGSSAGLLLLDLDNFKDINDTRGHSCGDELLKGVVEVLGRRLRKTDVLARLGGDEFAVLLPAVDHVQARAVAEELVTVIREESFFLFGATVQTTSSIGVAMIGIGGHTTPESLLMEADLAMYEAKAAGRDRAALRSNPPAVAGGPLS